MMYIFLPLEPIYVTAYIISLIMVFLFYQTDQGIHIEYQNL